MEKVEFRDDGAVFTFHESSGVKNRAARSETGADD